MRLAMTGLSVLMLLGNLIDGAIVGAVADGTLWSGNVDGWFLLRLGVELFLGAVGAAVSARCMLLSRREGARTARQALLEDAGRVAVKVSARLADRVERVTVPQ